MTDATSSPAPLPVLSVGYAAVKGTRHLERAAVHLDEQGAVGDRRWCLVDVAAQRVLRTVQHPGLVGVRADVVGDDVALTLPDGLVVGGPPAPTGETLDCDYWGRRVALALTDGPHADAFSTLLGRPVRLAEAPRGGVVFADPVTLVASASLADLGERLGVGAGLLHQVARFRATLLVETATPYAEDDWLGREVTVGDARLRIGSPIPRCSVVDIAPDTGRRDLPVLRTLAAHRPTNAAGEPCFGVSAQVVRPGSVGGRGATSPDGGRGATSPHGG